MTARVRSHATAPSRPRVRWTGPLLAAVLCVACSSSGHSSGTGSSRATYAPSPSLLGGTPAAAARTLTQRVAVSWKASAAEIFGPVRAPAFGQGTFDLPQQLGHETIDLPEGAHQELGTEQAIFLPTQVYLQPRGNGFAVLPPGKHWLTVSLAASDPVQTNFPTFIAQVEAVNPALLLAELEWGASASRRLGAGSLQGRQMSVPSYEVTIDLARALAHASGPMGQVLGEAIQEQLTASGSRTFTMTVWIDRRGRVVKMRGSLPGTGAGTETVALSSFGARVHVTTPDPDSVVDITSLTPSAERENKGGGDGDGG
jgi:hypothetical protein